MQAMTSNTGNLKKFYYFFIYLFFFCVPNQTCNLVVPTACDGMGQSEQLPISIGDYTPSLEIQRSKNGAQHVHLARALIISISVGGREGVVFLH